jgi:hypothetical protein
MDLEQLMGQYSRLKQELSVSGAGPAWHRGRIDRLMEDLVSIEREIAARLPRDEQCSEALPG